tara:strand:+ start:436 stop:945 length:510 start_codon:yes stop_codon:yes gene_type:complete
MSEETTSTVEDYLDADNFDFEAFEPIMSETIGKIAGSLAKAQSEMTMVEAKSTNPFFNSKYASLASVLETAMPALNKYEIALVQGNRWDNDNNGFYITSMLMHSSGEWIKSEIRMPIMKKDPHGVGAATTYGRRYLLSSMVGIAQADDDGNAGIKRAPRPSDQVNNKKQ